VTRVLAEHELEVVGIDLTPAMLDVARARVPQAAFEVGDLTALRLDDASFDLALCQQGLQFVPDQPTAVAEMARILRPNGRALVSCWQDVERSPLFSGFRDGLREVGWTDLESVFAMPFSLGADRLRELLREARFADVDVQDVELTLPIPDPRDVAEQYASVPPFSLRWEGADEGDRQRYLDAATALVTPGELVPFRTWIGSGRITR
jgi:SAM-dependent methyltransferase